ncbi:MAG: hypothetical protein LBK66_05085 [Spirochaetaceae bacterium]|jgi:hypothetical protein|nr:hypothetical protein [Spirochaetaceae bacterium]
MKTSSKICFLMWAIIFSGNLAAQESAQANTDLLRYYNTELFRWNYTVLSGVVLEFQNQRAIPAYRINSSMKKALIQYEDTNRQYRLYRGKNITGQILEFGGGLTVVVGAFIPVGGFLSALLGNYGAAEKSLTIGGEVILGGLISGLTGIFILNSGQENIFNAVNLYNRHKINEYQSN